MSGDESRVGFHQGLKWRQGGQPAHSGSGPISQGHLNSGFSNIWLSLLWLFLAWTTGPLSGRSLSFAYDDRLRRTNLTFRSGAVTNGTIGYGFDASGRMTSIADGSSSATYSYVANSSLLQQIQLKQGAATALTVTRQ